MSEYARCIMFGQNPTGTSMTAAEWTEAIKRQPDLLSKARGYIFGFNPDGTPRTFRAGAADCQLTGEPNENEKAVGDVLIGPPALILLSLALLWVIANPGPARGLLGALRG